MNAAVFARAPYSSRGEPDVTDSEDDILGGDAETLTLVPVAVGSGYAADFSVGLSGGSGSSRGARLRGRGRALVGEGRAARLGAAPGAGQAAARGDDHRGRAAVPRRRRIALRRTTLSAGTHTVRINLRSGVRAGAARLTLRLKDSAGNSKLYRRSLHVPKRRSG